MLNNLDAFLFTLINSGLANRLFDAVMPIITDKSYFLLIPIGIWMLIKNPRKAFLALLLAFGALIAADGITHVVKDVSGRPRPFLVLEHVRLLVGRGTSSSMPSGHAADAFAVVTAISMFFGGAIRGILLAGAGLVAFSRVYVGVHYPSDALAGSLIGAAVAIIVVWSYQFMKTKYRERAFVSVLLLSLCLISLFRIYFIATSNIDLSPDEAHYWEWSRRLDLSYYSKGPMIAYLIAGGTVLFGNTVLGVRIGAVILSALGSLILFATARRMYDEKTALFSSLLFQCIPLFSVFGVLMTIDGPFVFFWIASLYLLWRISEATLQGEKLLAWWILLGISVGLGLLTKYTMAFFWACTFLYLIWVPELRKSLGSAGPYLAVIVSLALFSPVVIWNAQHAWVTVKHTAGQAHLQKGFVLSLKDFFEFFVSQLGVVTPLVFAFMAIALIRGRNDGKGKFLLSCSVPVFLFFLLKSLQGKVQANWAMTAYITGIIAFSAFYGANNQGLKKHTRYLMIGSIVLAFLVMVFAHYPDPLHLPPSKDPSRRLKGWKELGQVVTAKAQALAGKGNYFIVSDKYQTASELAFYVRGNPVTYCANAGRRMNQYDLWPGFEDLRGYHALYVTPEDSMAPSFQSAFESCRKEEIAITIKGKKVNTFRIFECYNFRGIEKERVNSY